MWICGKAIRRGVWVGGWLGVPGALGVNAFLRLLGGLCGAPVLASSRQALQGRDGRTTGAGSAVAEGARCRFSSPPRRRCPRWSRSSSRWR